MEDLLSLIKTLLKVMTILGITLITMSGCSEIVIEIVSKDGSSKAAADTLSAFTTIRWFTVGILIFSWTLYGILIIAYQYFMKISDTSELDTKKE